MGHLMKIVHKAASALLATALLCGIGTTAFAAADTASLDLAQTGSVTMTLRTADDQTVITDGTFTLYQVADLVLEDGNMTYAYTDAFDGCTVSLENVTDTSLADTLAAYVSANEITGSAQPVSAEGTVTFSDLSLGLYLAVQTSQSSGYYTADPFLVSVPMDEDDVWVYDIDASPKMGVLTPVSETDTPGTTTNSPGTSASSSSSSSSGSLPKTGQLYWPIPALTVGGLLLFGFGWYLANKREGKNSHET